MRRKTVIQFVAALLAGAVLAGGLGRLTLGALRYGQRHIASPFDPLILLVVVALFLGAAGCALWILLASALRRSFLRASVIGMLGGTFLLYWAVALLFADSACLKCGGFSKTLYFWVNTSDLNETR
jgi:hypothetical protein